MGRNLFQQSYHKDLEKVYRNFDGVVLDNIVSEINDLQNYLENLKQKIDNNTLILISYHNHTWEPILILASKLGLRNNVGVQNWMDKEDVENILKLSGFEVIKTQKRFFGLTIVTTAKPKHKKKIKKENYSVSIIIPARNEAGNISKIIPDIPKFGKWQEIIFIEGHSGDQTWQIINKEISKYANGKIKVRAYKQNGKGKADAVKLGFEKAKGDILMIYDADRTVSANDLAKFYNAIASGLGDFINGSRLVYPMENDAMQTLNKMGNKFFGLVFTWVLGQRFKDTLCGTKAMWRHDLIKYRSDYNKYLKIDPFGDFALIFTAIKHNMKVVEIPVRYKERVYGSTNINRFYHGLLLCKMAILAFFEFKT